ncbi:MAG: alpha/beta hydrolase family protein, partial [bacterium]
VKAVVAVAGGPLGLQLSRNDPSARSVVERLSIPVLTLHGMNDNIVPVASVQEFETRARELGKSVEGHYIEGADHVLWSDPRFKTDLIRRSVEFLQRHIGR